MVQIKITEKEYNEDNLLYVQSSISEFISHAGCSVKIDGIDGRKILTINCSECYADLLRAEISDKVAEIIAIKYKYEFIKKNLLIGGLSQKEQEILITSLIAADLEEDKKYLFDRIKSLNYLAVDGIFYFRLKALKKKWKDVIEYIPNCFMNTQLKEFILYLLENKKRRVYVDGERVYDCHFRRLKRSNLVGGEEVKVLKEVLLSNCGEVELNGEIPKDDEYYLKEYFSDKLYFSRNEKQGGKYFN